ncbi:MAG: beta-galactosidase trimerization domain-containing protein [bacterium]|nr:beta-galactosidase trimerization domain-containing protein [bacterium]
MADWWSKKNWQMIQTNLREIDMQDIRSDQVVADLQAFQANGLMINAAGIIASYPTKLPYHFQSPHLTGDSLIDILAACHRANIRVIARTDFSKIRRPIYEMHPEWASVTHDGRVIDYNGDVQVCLNGNYQQDYALRIIEELLTTHPFDGIFFNMGGYKTSDYSGKYYGICQCENCKRLFREGYGLDLPKEERASDPVVRKYRMFQQETLKAHHAKVYGFITDLRPDVCIANHREFGRGFNRMESNTGMDRALPHWQYSASDNTRRAVSSYPEMVCSNTTVDFIDYPYRHVAVSPNQQALRLAQNLANGGALDYYLIGRLDNHRDRSGFAGIKRIYHYHAAHEDVYCDLESRADVALLNGETQEFRGWFRFLTEHHILFDSLEMDAAGELSWDRYRAVILPQVVSLCDALAEKINAFVTRGGTLIATGQPGFRNEAGELRNVPALDCLGIRRVTRTREDTRSVYFELDNRSGFARFGDTDLVFMDGLYVYADYAADVIPRLKMVPPHMFGPPERCYFTQVTDHPGLTQRYFGEGQAIYLPWLPGQLYHRQGVANTFDFVGDVMEGLAGLRSVGKNLSPMVEVTRFARADGSMDLVHLVNGSGHFGVSFFEPVQMADVDVVIPCDRKPSSVRGLVSGIDLDFAVTDGNICIRIPKLGLFEAIAIS